MSKTHAELAISQLREAKLNIRAARTHNEEGLGIDVTKSVTEKGCTTDFGMMKLEGFADVAVVLKGDGNGDTLWLVRGSENAPIFQVCFGFGDDVRKAQTESKAATPELGDIAAVVPFSKSDTRAMLGFGTSGDTREALQNFLALYNKSRAALSYKPKVLDGDKTHFCKALDKVEADEFGELRLVTGVVLEPDIVDSQDDTYNSDEIRKTAHLYMLDYQNVGLQHKAIINSVARPVESFTVPENTQGGVEIGGVLVKSGTWVMTVKVFDDDIWAGIKRGELTGFSIGGFAKRIPIADDPPVHNPNSIM